MRPTTNSTIIRIGRAAAAVGCAAALATAFAASPPPGPAPVMTFTKIADTDTFIPDGAGTFSTVWYHPVLSEGNVAFYGTGPVSQAGIYLFADGVLTRVADKNTVVPGGSSTFSTFNQNTSISGTNVAFLGAGGLRHGAYKYLNGDLLLVADDTTPVAPFGTPLPIGFGSVSIDGKHVALMDANSSEWGVYLELNGEVGAIVDLNTPIPGAPTESTFDGFDGPPMLSGLTVLLGGSSYAVPPDTTGQGGRFMFRPGPEYVGTVADAYTPSPGGTGSLGNISPSSFRDGVAAFSATDASPENNIYRYDASGVSLVANRNTNVPGGSGNETFSGFDGNSPSVSNDWVGFIGRDGSGDLGIYLHASGTLFRILVLGESLDGRTITYLTMGREGLHGNDLAFWADFSDGSEGIFVADIYLDADTDAVSGGDDCDDSDVTVWSTPSEVDGVEFLDDQMLVWNVPVEPGATSVWYDTIRSTDPANFYSGVSCVDTDGGDAMTIDPELPASGEVFYYVVRAENPCPGPSGQGPPGDASDCPV